MSRRINIEIEGTGEGGRKMRKKGKKGQNKKRAKALCGG